jgi:protein transport protein SEC13
VQVLARPVQVLARPVQVRVPPVQVRVPPVQVRVPPVQVRVPPVQVRVPPVQVRGAGAAGVSSSSALPHPTSTANPATSNKPNSQLRTFMMASS